MFFQADDDTFTPGESLHENLHQLCLLCQFVASSAFQHWIWTLAIAAALSFYYRTRERKADPGASVWYLSGLGYWVQELPRIVYLLFSIVGIIGGLIYGGNTHSPLKISMFFGGVAGFFFLPMLLLAFDMVIEMLVFTVLLFILHWIFC
jgi:Slime mold cyclic AMP receptor